MAREDYHNARVAGRKAYRADVQAGRYPYLPALDDMISYSETQGESPLGRVDIPLNLIVGTKTAGRQKAFASNFMPLLGENTEFGMKWATLAREDFFVSASFAACSLRYCSFAWKPAEG